MAIKINRWSPNTCDCSVEYSWDSDLPAESRVHTLTQVVKKCPAHAALSDSEVWDTLFEENPRWNRAMAALETVASDAYSTVTLPDGSTVKYLTGGRKIAWAFDASRNLVITLTNFKVNEVNAITTAAASVSGRIIIQTG